MPLDLGRIMMIGALCTSALIAPAMSADEKATGVANVPSRSGKRPTIIDSKNLIRPNRRPQCANQQGETKTGSERRKLMRECIQSAPAANPVSPAKPAPVAKPAAPAKPIAPAKPLEPAGRG